MLSSIDGDKTSAGPFVIKCCALAWIAGSTLVAERSLPAKALFLLYQSSVGETAFVMYEVRGYLSFCSVHFVRGPRPDGGIILGPWKRSAW